MFFGMYKTLLVYDEMVVVGIGGNRRHVGWGNGRVMTLLGAEAYFHEGMRIVESFSFAGIVVFGKVSWY